MRSIAFLALFVLLAPPAMGAVQGAAEADSSYGVSAQGLLEKTPSPRICTSPRGTCTLEVFPVESGFHGLTADLRITTERGLSRFIPRVRGNGFLVSDKARIVAIDTKDTTKVPSRVAVLDFLGRELRAWDVHYLTDPRLSSDGARLAFRSEKGITVLDLETFAESTYPNLGRFSAGPGGKLAGVAAEDPTRLVLYEGRRKMGAVSLGALPRRIAFSRDGASILVLTREELIRFDPRGGGREVLYTAPGRTELRDLHVTRKAIFLGMRKGGGGKTSGMRVTFDPQGRFLGVQAGPAVTNPVSSGTPVPPKGIPWPLKPDYQHPVGNTYGEYQNYGGSPYMHPGVDVMGYPGQPVFAVRSGVVKVVLTTSGQWHWRVAVGDEDTSGTTGGYLYAHLDEYTIAVDTGDRVEQGQYLGDLVHWPSYNFTHIHFARIEDSGTMWYGRWLCTENPHLDFGDQTEKAPPRFEPARGGDLFAFCYNETSTYQDPTALQGQVDIIAHVGDRIASAWVCTVQEIRYSIHPQGAPGSPVVDDKLAVFYDMDLDTYDNGIIDSFLVDLLYKEDGVCDTNGSYSSREFYHIITNSDGDQVYEAADQMEAWDTTLLSDGNYVIKVTALDVAGNSATATMVVTTANGNP